MKSLFEFESIFLNKKELLLHYYKTLNLSDNGLIVLMFVVVFSFYQRKFLTAKYISKHTNLTEKTVNDIFVILQKRKLMYLKINTDYLEMDLDPLFKKIFNLYRQDLNITQFKILIMEKIDKQLTSDDIKYIRNKIYKKLSLFCLKTILTKIQGLISFQELKKHIELFNIHDIESKSEKDQLTKFN